MKITEQDLDDLAVRAKQMLLDRVLHEVLSRQDLQEEKDRIVAELRSRLVKKLNLTLSISNGDVNKEG